MTGPLIVLIPQGHYGLSSVRLLADKWAVDSGRLVVTARTRRAAEFAPDAWTAVIDDALRDPAELETGGLAAARRALAQIADGCRDGWLTDPARIARIAADGLMEVST